MRAPECLIQRFIRWDSEAAMKRLDHQPLSASHDPRDRVRHPAPRLGLAVERAATNGRQAVVLGAAVVLGEPPLGPEKPSYLEAVESRVERPFFDAEDVVRRLLDAAGDGVSVHQATRADGLQNEHLQSARHELSRRLTHN